MFLSITDQDVLPRRAGFPPRQTVGRQSSSLGEEAHLDLGQDPDVPPDAVTAPIAAPSAGAPAHLVALYPEGVGVLQRFRGRVQRVGHVAVHGRGTVPVGPGTHPAADGLVVGEGVVSLGVPAADGDVVHRPLAGRRHPFGEGLGQGPQEHVHDALGGLHVPPRHRSRSRRVHHRPLRRDDPDGGQAAAVVGHVQADEAAEDVVDGREGDGVDGVDASPLLGGRTGEIHRRRVALDGDGDADGDGFVADAVVVQVVGEAVGAVGHPLQEPPGHPFGVGQQGLHVVGDFLNPVAGDDLLQADHPALVGSQLGSQVAGPLLRRAHVGQDQVHHPLVEPAPLGQLQGRDDEPFLVDLPGHGHRAGGHPPHVGVVGPVGGEAEEAQLSGLLDEDGRDEGDVGQVGAPPEGVVEDHHVPRCEGDLLDGLGHREGHRAQVDGDVGGLGDHPALGVEEGAGKVPAFLDVGGVAGLAQHHPHLLGNGGEEVLEDFQADGVVGRLGHRGLLSPF